MTPRTVSITGSTGSIGTQAIEVMQANPDLFHAKALAAYASVDLLVEQAQSLRPEIVALGDETKAQGLAGRLPAGTELRVGSAAVASVAVEADVVVNGITGFAGLEVTLAALHAGKRLALANKESLITAAPLVRQALTTPGAEMLPVDSEHGALHQCLRAETPNGAGSGRRIQRLIVTASGGPFRGQTLEQLQDVTVEQALTHPTWKMGPKITIDSSTLFNKGLEVIEAHELFAVEYDCIEVVVHPQSVMHSAVEFTDGSTIAQLSMPDMRLPIGYAMGHPDRLPKPYGQIDWTRLGSLDFEPVDLRTFRCLALAYEAGRTGGTAPAWLNAANEVAVDAFLNRLVTWAQISSIIGETLETYDGAPADSLERVIVADDVARTTARAIVQRGLSG